MNLSNYLLLERGWKPLDKTKYLTGIGLIAGLIFWQAADDDHYLLFLDNVNLAFHEAGHLFFRILGDTASLYGGTLGQLVMPLIVMTVFARQRDPMSFAVAGAWLFQNFHNIARYMADARAQVLPLVGGGDHDWFNIFWRWNAIDQDIQVANITAGIGWLGMVLCAVWLFLLRKQQHQ